ncbi:MAG TPA: hypothetical protein VMV69_04345 [Pirellulales bacterium]|nr:hypothetical protein [Pirellulales bacterium]
MSWDRVDALLDKLSQWLNPILVKETRQALKSRQFALTFTLVLACAWIWSLFGIAMIGPGVRYAAEGLRMFNGYYVILSFAVLVIVPFGAFRSLASEREDGTYELLSVTTLRPRQIVSGKLGSAVLQMLVYFSAIAPCLGFTYMLRGVAFPVILYVMMVLLLVSLGLSMIGMLVATATREKHWQSVLSVVLILGLGYVFLMGCVLVIGPLGSGAAIPMDDTDFWIVNLGLLTGYLGYFALFYFATAAQLTFASDNRSRVLRIVMLAQQATLIGWMGWGFFQEGHIGYVAVLLTVSGLHWYVMGAFLSGESGELSRRVKRQLPQSFLGRALLTWFNPGPATGYLFAVVNLLSVYGIALLALLVGELAFSKRASSWGFGANYNQTLAVYGLLVVSYMVVYLGVGRILIGLLRKISALSMPVGVLLHLLLVLAGTGVPMTIHYMRPGIRNDYSLIEMSNPFWTLEEAGNRSTGLSPEIVVVACVVPLVAAAVLLANLPAVVAAVRQVRIAKPRRVAEEDAFVESRRASPPVPSSPFD